MPSKNSTELSKKEDSSSVISIKAGRSNKERIGIIYHGKKLKQFDRMNNNLKWKKKEKEDLIERDYSYETWQSKQFCIMKRTFVDTNWLK